MSVAGKSDEDNGTWVEKKATQDHPWIPKPEDNPGGTPRGSGASDGSSDYGIVMMQQMLQQMQQNFNMLMQQMQQQMTVPEYTPPPLQRARKRLDIEEERAKIRDRLAEEREANKQDKRNLASTLRTTQSLLEKDPTVIGGESLLNMNPAEGEEL